ncbi:MAG TPA: transporter, partial [Longimicrobiales bacterium]|nr:transporter [Longimicrobiales bacterium]
SFGINTVFPVGQYDSQEPLNVGGNQWKVRFSLPVVRALGPWVPGSRTTVEVTPSLTWLGDNDDVRDQTVSQDPLVSVEAHLTRDVTRRAALSADYSFIRFGESTTTSNATGAPTGARSAATTHLLGATAHFEINDNLGAYVTHMQTFAEDETPIVLEGALLRITLTWSFHRVIERRRNLGGS